MTRWLSIICFLLVAACSAPSGPGGAGGPTGDESGGGILGGVTSPGGSVPGAEGSGGGSVGGSSGGGSAPGSGGMSGPQASIPAPMAKKMLVANADSNNYTPVVGFEGAVEDPAYRTSDYQVLVSDVPMVAEEDTPAVSAFSALHTPRSIFARLLSPFVKWFPSSLSSAFAQTSDGTDAPLPEGFNPPIWDRAGVVAHCPINADGSFECYPQAANDTELYVYVTDGRRVGEQISDTPNKNVLYLTEAPKDVTKGPSMTNPDEPDTQFNQIFSVTNDKGLVIDEVDNDFQVHGNYLNNYESFDATGATELAFDPSRMELAMSTPLGIVGLLLPPIDVLRADADGGANFTLDGDPVTVPGANQYTSLKYLSDGLRFSVAFTEPSTSGQIFHVNRRLAADQITFLSSDIIGVNLKKTLAFDVDGTYALVAFLDDAGKTRLRMGSNTGLLALRQFGGATPLPGDYDIKDIQIFQKNKLPANPTVPADPGHALILDTLNNRVGIIDFNYRVMPAVLNISWPTNLAMGAGKAPESFILNPGPVKTKAYVVNKGDNTLSVIDLTNPTAAPGTINLQTYLPGKELNIKPNEVAFNAAGDHLIIGAEDLKSALVIPVNP